VTDTVWSASCLLELELNHPNLAFEVLVIALRRATSIEEVSILAAGTLEQIIVDHGPSMIDRIEALAKTSRRFRFALSGVWPQGRKETDVWQRVLAAASAGPQMDQTDALPPPDL
jgi:hypothetical protein